MDINESYYRKQIEMDRRLYYRIDDELVTKEEDGSLTFLKGGTADFDTYFNSFSIGKWREYTVLETVQLGLKLQGSFTIYLKHHVLKEGKDGEEDEVKTEILEEKTVFSAEPQYVIMDFGEPKETGIYSFQLRANAKGRQIPGRQISGGKQSSCEHECQYRSGYLYLQAGKVCGAEHERPEKDDFGESGLPSLPSSLCLYLR